MMKIKPVAPKLLSTKCSPKQLNFETTDELDELNEPVGQDRAMAAIDLGIHIHQSGFNLYLLGPEGTGKHHLINSVLKLQAKSQPTADDWCYINNFENPQKPLVLRLPPGMGLPLQKDLLDLIEELRTEIPAILDSAEFHARVQKLEEELKDRQEQALKTLQDQADHDGLSIVTTPRGFVVTALRDDKPMTSKEFMALPEAERQQQQKKIDSIRDQLTKMLEELPYWHKEKHDKQKNIQKEFILVVVSKLIEQLNNKYQDYSAVLKYLAAVETDIIENAQDFYRSEKREADPLAFIRYQVNVLVTHTADSGAPVIYENHPTHANLIGRAEYLSQFGALVTNFTLIRAGALHRANGGYLIVDAQQILTQPFAWESLKRALYAQNITLESLGQAMGFPSTVSLEPEPIPLQAKIILLGERSLYYLLCEHDVNFPDLFKVAADFSNHIPRTPANFAVFARLIGTITKKEQLLPLNRHAVAKMIDHSTRLANDTQRLFTHKRCLIDLLRESTYWARQNNHPVIKAADVQQAIDQQIYRANRIETRIREDFRRNILLIDTKGKKVGQVNGLSVLQIGHYSFGSPSRITATARLGKGEVIDIEREVELGGAIHSKGVLILSGFLSGRYLVEHHLSVSASLVFEQNYGEVEGDSASAAELAALLSAIAHLPVKQSIAVTGSVNQYGQIQPVGNVNEKIEGFFTICQTKGFNRRQGVIIPAGNVQHLMLRDEVVVAAKKKSFFVYGVETIDQVMTLLTGLPAGKPNKKGHFPENTINGRIEQSLLAYAEHADGEHEHKENQ